MNFIQRYQPSLSWVSELDRLFDQTFRNPAFTLSPREAFHEAENAWILRLDLPGFDKQDIKLTMHDHTLQVAAESPADRPFGGKFEGQWRLGQEVDSNGIFAQLENGVLELNLPKKQSTASAPCSIPIS
jgi:HSP20 family protein